jgi:hypothetical protein
MEVVVTVIWPEEPVNSVPMTPAEAEGANVAQASTAKLKAPNFSAYRIFIVFLRKVHGHCLKLWMALGTRIRTLRELVNEPICAGSIKQYPVRVFWGVQWYD